MSVDASKISDIINQESKRGGERKELAEAVVEQEKLKAGKRNQDDQGDQGDKKGKIEARKILLKEIPGIEDHLPGDVDLNVGIHDPLKKLDGSSYNNDQCAFILSINDWENIELVELLLKNGANPNATTNTGYAQDVTALMFAVRTMPERTITALLQYGADFRLKDSNGYTVLDWAGHYVQPGSPDALVMNQRFVFSMMDPDKGRSLVPQYNLLPLLSAMHAYYKGQELREILSADNTEMPLSVCGLIEQYRVELTDFSLAFSREPRHLHLQMFNLMKRGNEKYNKNKKLDKLAELSEEALDQLISAQAQVRDASYHSSTSEMNSGEDSSAPLVFSVRNKVKQ